MLRSYILLFFQKNSRMIILPKEENFWLKPKSFTRRISNNKISLKMLKILIIQLWKRPNKLISKIFLTK